MKYIIADKKFSTKKEITEYCKALKRTVGIIYVADSIGYRFLTALIREGHLNAKHKLRKAINYIYVDKNKYGITRFMLKYLDGTEDDFSYISCIDNLGKETEEARKSRIRKKKNSAYRLSIKDQIQEFRNNSYNICELCGNSSINTIFHVDHKNPTFAQLIEDFENIVNVSIPEEFIDIDTTSYEHGRHMFREEDRKYCEWWKDYHKKCANLQILCSKCNLTRSSPSCG